MKKLLLILCSVIFLNSCGIMTDRRIDNIKVHKVIDSPRPALILSDGRLYAIPQSTTELITFYKEKKDEITCIVILNNVVQRICSKE